MILIVTYANNFRFHVVADSVALSKDELKLFIERVVAELSDLNGTENLSRDLSIAN